MLVAMDTIHFNLGEARQIFQNKIILLLRIYCYKAVLPSHEATVVFDSHSFLNYT
jgi:hypothetical protein